MVATDPLPITMHQPVVISPEPIEEAMRQLQVCNACRYCEGYCAVFLALERRSIVTPGNAEYLSNLCHDCRGCFYACPFTPPHDYAINLPRILSEVRRETYSRYALPAVATRILAGNGRLLAGLAALIFGLLAIGVIATGNGARFFAPNEGPGSFYQVIPYLLMVVPALAISLGVVVLLTAGGVRFWQKTRGSLNDLIYPRAVISATADVLGLHYMTGGGAGGCNYPEERPSLSRYFMHMLVFYGFLAAIVSTTSAYINEHFLEILSPFPLLSVPVIFGTAGGVAMLVGTCGLIYLKRQSDQEPADPEHIGMDYVFLVLLGLVNLTGLLLLGFSDTAAMGTLLTVHIALVFTLFLSMPYSKFAHFVYRYSALVQNRLEDRRGIVD